MDDVDRFIEKRGKSSPGFSQRVEQRAVELEIAYRLRCTRKSRRLTQEQVAANSSISRRVISRIENGHDDQISLHALKQYARALGLTVTMDLVSDTPDSEG
jgi:transcriptional regulator with XRE-family HTH domain